MTTNDALALIERIRDEREANDKARADILIAAARIANDDDAEGDPDVMVNGFKHSPGAATRSLTYADRMRWFATLVETVGTLDRYKAWRARTAGMHHEASAALDECISCTATRATVAVTILLYGLPPVGEVAA